VLGSNAERSTRGHYRHDHDGRGYRASSRRDQEDHPGPEFQERVREDALLEREIELFDELEDLDFLQYGSRATS